VNEPLVSVVIPLFNKENYIEATLQSVVNQTYGEIELVIMDDSSTDKSYQLAEAFLQSHSQRFRNIKIRSRRNTGQAGARNDGIASAEGEYVAFLDADDVWHPEKLEKQVDLLERHSHLDIVFCNYMMLFPTASSTKAVRFVPLQQKIRNWLLTSGYGGAMESTAVIRKSSLVSYGSFDEELQMCGGLDLAFRMSVNDSSDCVDEYLCGYRITPTGWHNNKKDLMISYEALMKKKHLYGPFEPSMRRNLTLHLQLWNLRRGFSKVNVIELLQEVRESPRSAFVYFGQTLLRVIAAQVRGLLHPSRARILMRIARIS